MYNYSCAPLFPPPLNLAVFIPTFLARVLHNADQKRAGYDIYDNLPAQYETKSVIENEHRARKRRKIVLKFFRKRKRQQTKEKMRLEMEEKELASFSARGGGMEAFIPEKLDPQQ